jgi:uncharacterized repeat protein (TIGR03803 family)
MNSSLAQCVYCDSCKRDLHPERQRTVAFTLVLELALVLAMLGAGAARAQTFSVLYTFTGGVDGREPYAGLVRDKAGNLYGTTYAGGAFGMGTVFKVAQSGKETVLHNFSGAPDGANPLAGLVRDASGNLYGATLVGGTEGNGAVFKVDKTGKETMLCSFKEGNPAGSLVLDPAGNLYGTTNVGGLYGFGSVFKVNKTGKETRLYSFVGGHFDGEYPIAGLIRDREGNLYGTTYGGGNYGYGTVFVLAKHGGQTVLHSFAYNHGDGEFPYAGLVRDARGNLYGTTTGGGFFGGTVFRVSESGVEALLYSFTDGSDGGVPYAGLVRDSAGNLYGTTYNGGAYGYGTVFKVDTSGHETVLHSFSYATDGGYPYAGLVRDAAGNFYGTTFQGGASGAGTVFKLTP